MPKTVLLLLCLFLISADTNAQAPEFTKDAPPSNSISPLARIPSSSLNTRLAAPIKTWDEAIPLGNGLMGGLLWGEGSKLKISLDRGDMWDVRRHPNTLEKGFTYANLQELIKRKDTQEIERLTDTPYDYGAPPTKLPAGRIEIELDDSAKLKEFELKLGSAEGVGHLADGRQIQVFYSANKSVAMMWIPGLAPKSWKILVPSVVKKLGYKEALQFDSGAPDLPGGKYRWFTQDALGAFQFGVYASESRLNSGTLIAWTIFKTNSGSNPIAEARKLVDDAIASGYTGTLKPHQEWWKAFWNKSAISLPDKDILRHYYFVQYLYGAGSRVGAPPIPLQGVWTADNGNLPPWKGDYHNDLNTQMTYMGYQESGRFESGQSFLDFNWNLLPEYRKFAKSFFGTEGANVPGVMAIDGAPLTGWAQYSLSPTMGAWVGDLFVRHWRFTADQSFLKKMAYPWCSEIGTSIAQLLKPDSTGRLVFPLSSSPEIHDNSLRAWLKPNSNYDIMSSKALFLGLQEMATSLGKKDEALKWKKLSDGLGDYHVDPDGSLSLAEGEPLKESHRHLSQLIGVYPFGLINTDGGAEDLRRIDSTLKQWERLGTGAWCGYSFAWMSALQARVGRAESAFKNLNIFVKAFTLRNGFHANGDQSGKGYSGFTYRPFTLEGNMQACGAVHEMLVQSWNTPGLKEPGSIRIFPAVPWHFHDVAFDDLRLEGGHRISARRVKNATVWFQITAGRDGPVRIRDNFGTGPIDWDATNIRREGKDYVINLKKGQRLTANLAIPDSFPPPPDASGR